MLQNYNFYRVLSAFLESPTKGFGWRELSKAVDIGPPSTKKYIDELKAEGIVVERRLAGRLLYYANRESRKYRIWKAFDMALKLEDSGLVELINKECGYPAIVLFGSYASGEAVEGSDIDIAVITESRKIPDLKAFEKTLKREIHIMRLSRQSLESMKKQNPSLFNGIINGIVISGRLEVY